MTTLRRMVVEMILDRGCGTVDHLEPHLSELGYTREQILKAMQNAKARGYLWTEGKVSRRGMGRGAPCPAVYWPGAIPMQDKAKREKLPPMVASVFDLADPKPETAWPDWTGVVHRPMGEWV